MKKIIALLVLSMLPNSMMGSTKVWGFFGHRLINRTAVYTLPLPLYSFYKKHLQSITDLATLPDQRRYAVKGEAERHYIDMDAPELTSVLGCSFKDACAQLGEDSLRMYGIAPWNLQEQYDRLVFAFKIQDTKRIIQLSAEVGHYIADLHVPLHCTTNYNGQLSNQKGIHGLWESVLPEKFSETYDLFLPKAKYISSISEECWNIAYSSQSLVASVLDIERKITEEKFFRGGKYQKVDKNSQSFNSYSQEFSLAYHKALEGQVEQRMREAIQSVGSFWLSAYLDAGAPNLEKEESITDLHIDLQDSLSNTQKFEPLRKCH